MTAKKETTAKAPAKPAISDLQRQLEEVKSKMKVTPFLSDEYNDLNIKMRSIMKRQIIAGERN